ncbi:hypothetical protein D3C78_1221240 [compost metagenome]
MAVISGMTLEGDERTKTVSVPLGEANDNAHKRIADTGLQLMALGDKVQIAAVRFGSAARKAGFEEGFDITAIQLPAQRPSPYWFYVPGVLLLMAVWLLQGRRMEAAPAPQRTPVSAA